MRRLIVLLLLLLNAPQAFAQGASALQSEASHIAIVDHDTGVLLFCKNCETPMPPASMSKLMTALLVREKIANKQLSFDTMLPVSENAWRHGAQSDGSHMFLDIHSQVAVRDLLEGVIVVSANDACIALAEGISGSEAAFVREMNQRAKELGLTSAHFSNVTGLPDADHVISARDLANLTSYLVRTYPDLYAIYSKPELTFNNHTQQNRNPLLGAYPGADGVKTGHTNTSGYGLVASAVENGRRRIVVFNGMPTQAARAREAQRLMRAAFTEFEAVTLFNKGEAVGAAEVWLGGSRSVPLVAREPIVFGHHKSLDGRLSAQIVYRAPVTAPVKAGDPIGELVVQGPDFAPRRFPLVAGKAVGRMNVFGRAIAGASALLSGKP